VEAGEAELHLRLDSERPYHSEAVCGADGALEQGRFSDAGLAAEDECSTEPTAGGVEQGVERCPLAGSIKENRAARSSDRTDRCLAR
jgi:hypothetical protein